MKNYGKVTNKIIKELKLTKNVDRIEIKSNIHKIPIFQYFITIIFKNSKRLEIILRAYNEYEFTKTDYKEYITNKILKNKELFN